MSCVPELNEFVNEWINELINKQVNYVVNQLMNQERPVGKSTLDKLYDTVPARDLDAQVICDE